jgi:hypothetical protein
VGTLSVDIVDHEAMNVEVDREWTGGYLAAFCMLYGVGEPLVDGGGIGIPGMGEVTRESCESKWNRVNRSSWDNRDLMTYLIIGIDCRKPDFKLVL